MITFHLRLYERLIVVPLVRSADKRYVAGRCRPASSLHAGVECGASRVPSPARAPWTRRTVLTRDCPVGDSPQTPLRTRVTCADSWVGYYCVEYIQYCTLISVEFYDSLIVLRFSPSIGSSEFPSSSTAHSVRLATAAEYSRVLSEFTLYFSDLSSVSHLTSVHLTLS